MTVLVCHCFAVYSDEVDEAIGAGASTVRELAETTGAGAGCGGCHLALCRRLGSHAADACGGDSCLRAMLGSGRLAGAVA